MEQSKSPKSIAYSRLGKPNSAKPASSSQNFARKSTGNIYEDLIGQFDPKQQKYIRDLINKNMKQQAEATATSAFHSRRKSYADLQIQHPNNDKAKDEHSREQRETLCKTKPTKDLALPHQATPKNNNSLQMVRSDFINRSSLNLENNPNKISYLIQRESTKLPAPSFLDNLSNYLQSLNQADEHVIKANISGQKLGETLKISYGIDENHKYASKIQQQMLKIKELKLKNHYIQKQLMKKDKREAKMKHCLYEMLQQVKQVHNELTKQKKERKRLEKVIEIFQIRNQQFQRKTIGKNYNLTKIQEFQTKINAFAQNQPEKTELDSSFREVWKHSTAGKSKSKHPIYISQGGFEQPRRGQLDSSKIQKMFRSNYHSEEEQDDIYQ